MGADRGDDDRRGRAAGCPDHRVLRRRRGREGSEHRPHLAHCRRDGTSDYYFRGIIQESQADFILQTYGKLTFKLVENAGPLTRMGLTLGTWSSLHRGGPTGTGGPNESPKVWYEADLYGSSSARSRSTRASCSRSSSTGRPTPARAAGPTSSSAYCSGGIAASVPLKFIAPSFGAWQFKASVTALVLGDNLRRVNARDELEFIGTAGVAFTY